MPSAISARSTITDSAAAVAFSQPRPKEPIAGTRIRVAKAIRLISPAPPKIHSSSDIGLILPEVGDDQCERGDDPEERDSQRPPAADVAEVVHAEVDPAQPDRDGGDDPGDDDGRSTRHPGAGAERADDRDPDVDDRVGRVPARK